jgi:hypothetical protein
VTGLNGPDPAGVPVPILLIARRLALATGSTDEAAEARWTAAVRSLAAETATPLVVGWGGYGAVSQPDADALFDALFAESEIKSRAEEAALAAADQVPEVPRTGVSLTEHVRLMGGVENTSRWAGSQDMPLNPIRVIDQAELERQQMVIQQRNIPGIPYREPVDHVVPADTTGRRPRSAIIDQWIAEGSSWA